jgi:maleylacetoacetate isomerase
MTRPVLHDYARSSAAYRVRIALNLKRVDYESRQVDLVAGEQHSPAYRQLNPLGLVPMLEIDGHRLTQSLAIMVYLDQRFPDPLLMPPDPGDGAHVRALALAIACEIHPINNLRVRKYLSGELGLDKAAVDAWYVHWIVEGFDALEAMAAPKAGAFLFGDAPTLADICLVPQMYNARRFEVPVEPYPTLVRADQNATKLEAFASAHPDRQEASK